MLLTALEADANQSVGHERVQMTKNNVDRKLSFFAVCRFI